MKQDSAARRLQANAANMGVTITDEEAARIAAGAYLRNVEAFERLVASVPPDTIPDYLKDWGPAAAGTTGPAEEGEAR